MLQSAINYKMIGATIMLKIVQPKPIYLAGGEDAVLLLHSFTSTTRDMKKLAKFLQAQQFSCYVAAYDGHGLQPEEILRYSPADWWQNVLAGYNFLKSRAQRVFVVGVSLGGIFALRLAEQQHIDGLVIMSVPQQRTANELFERVMYYANNYKKLIRTPAEQLQQELGALLETDLTPLHSFSDVIRDTMTQLPTITAPIAIKYGERDENLYETSANFIAQHVSSATKHVQAYANSSHLMTLSKDQQQLYEDISTFLKQL